MSTRRWIIQSFFLTLSLALTNSVTAQLNHDHDHDEALEFSIRSVKSGAWSNPETWDPARVPKTGDRVLVSRDTIVDYDAHSPNVIRLVQIVGTLSFSREVDTELNVGLITIQHSDRCSEEGFACEFEGADEGPTTPLDQWPALIIGTPHEPIPFGKTARVRLHHIAGMDPKNAPAIACCSGTMEIHGSPLSRTWLKLGDDNSNGDTTLKLSEPVEGWQVGDELIVTATQRAQGNGTFRAGTPRSKTPQTEPRTIVAIEGTTITVDKPFQYDHSGTGEFQGEVANLSRNVIIESADPNEARGHTVYHRHSRGGISYARFAHLGKEGELGRYAIHYHLVGDTMRGSQVLGASIVDSHNRWVTIHGTQYLVVRDCVGYQSVGHGYFLEDGTEVFNLLDRNLAVQAFTGRRLPEQALPFDPNDGAGYWWANGLNSFTRNVSVENDEYGYRYDMQRRSNFDSSLPIRQSDGSERTVDVRTIPIWRFSGNEAHSEGFYGMVVAANGNSQPDSPIHDERMLERIKSIDWTGPDTRHPHTIQDLTIWGSHYAFRPHSPAMKMENVRLHDAAYGIYRPAFENHEYRNLHISDIAAEPFNRGMDDASAQTGVITVDGLTFETGYGNSSTPLIQISDVNINGNAETHLRNVIVDRPEQYSDRWPLINRGVGPRVRPITKGVPIYIHDHYGSGRHAKVVSQAASDLIGDGNDYRDEPPLTGNESKVAEVADITWPNVLEAVDDVPPATIITSMQRLDSVVRVKGITHDNGEVAVVEVNGQRAQMNSQQYGVAEWTCEIQHRQGMTITAQAKDASGNSEQTPHQIAPPK